MTEARRKELELSSNEGAGPDPVIEAYKTNVDRTLIRENLRMTATDRARRLQELLALHGELRAAGERSRPKDSV